ncbi:Tetraspanin/Peripherin [Macleaya cordata]|uniref:Tetraspanin/Peripherin n=1 Tax=Macleaya cordata TaxID=56857 RepID=A0A200PT77_MACCD|nr:Tetraspanin/Peripherin [Macleaya cordata]
MGRGLSNNLIAIISALTLLISMPILLFAAFPLLHGGRAAGGGVGYVADKATECFETIQGPCLTFALCLFIMSILGIIGSCCKVTSFLWAYLVFTFLSIIGLICFTIFIFLVTSTSKSSSTGPIIIDENGHPYYSLKGYSPWLKKQVVDGRNWNKLKSCMVISGVCHGTGDYDNITDMKTALERLNPIQVLILSSI